MARKTQKSRQSPVLLSQINFDHVITDVISVAAMLASVFVVVLGCRIILGFIRGSEFGSFVDQDDSYTGDGEDHAFDDDDSNPLGKSDF